MGKASTNKNTKKAKKKKKNPNKPPKNMWTSAAVRRWKRRQGELKEVARKTGVYC